MQDRKKYNRADFYTTNSIDGNTVRKLDRALPLERPDYDPVRRQKPVVRERARRQEQPRGIDFVSFVFLAGAILLTLFVCVNYLSVQAGIIRMNKAIASLESDIAYLENENNAALERLNASIDLAHVYKVATKKLGMVHPKENQVITYENTKSDYVRQYSAIPDTEEKVLQKSITGK